MTPKKAINTTLSDFRNLLKDNRFYYVDKTMFIKDLIADKCDCLGVNFPF